METQLTAVTIVVGAEYIQVTPVFSNVDRPVCFAWNLKLTHMAMAQRLKRAIMDGKVLLNRCVRRDINGKTYAGFDVNILGRHMNADLKRLGY